MTGGLTDGSGPSTSASDRDTDDATLPSAGSVSSGTSSGESTGAADACVDVDGTCLPSAPEGFTGPYAVRRGDPGAVAACPEDWAADELVAQDGLSVPPSTCDCSCGAPLEFVCPSAEVENHFDAGCTNFVSTTTLPVDQCVNTNGFSFVPAFDTAPVSGSCAAVESFDVPPAGFTEEIRACLREPTIGACEPGEGCGADVPEDSQLCIAAAGDVVCPEGPYTEHSLVYNGVEDDRQCAPACECSDIQGTCSPNLRFWNSLDCPGGHNFNTGVESCVATAYGSARYNVSLSGGSCADPDVSLQGSAEPSDPTTLCCLTGTSDAP